jgi:hypothetical protein
MTSLPKLRNIRPLSDPKGSNRVHFSNNHGLSPICQQVPTMVADVKIPPRTTIQASAANGISPNKTGLMTGGNAGGGGVQFQIQVPTKNLDPDWFKNARPLK